MLRYAVAAATSLVLLTGLTACGGDPPPPRAQPSSTSTSPSSTPTPTPPALPAAAKKHTKAGAEAFVRHYIELINYAQASGDIRPMRRAQSARCSSCRQVQKVIHRIYARGGHIRGGAWQWSLIATNSDGRGGWVIDGVAKFGKQRVYREGRKVQQLKGGSLPLSFFIANQHSTWEVAEWTRGR